MHANIARDEYRGIRSIRCWIAMGGITHAEFDRMARDVVTDATDPRSWVDAAKAIRLRCGRCAGTGRFVTGTVNGVPTGPGGECFRCQGKGWQDLDDAYRNTARDKHAFHEECRLMMGG